MKSIFRNVLFYSFSLFVLTQFLTGVNISGGLPTYIFGGIVLSIMFLIVKPILNIIALPLNIITLGTFSFFINVIILYLLTMFVPNIKIVPFIFQGYSFAGFIIPKVSLNQFFAVFVVGIFLSIIVTFLSWLIEK